jgi:hypothetical protein
MSIKEKDNICKSKGNKFKRNFALGNKKGYNKNFKGNRKKQNLIIE